MTDQHALVSTFEAITARFGEIDVLEYSPFPRDSRGITVTGAADVTVETLQPPASMPDTIAATHLDLHRGRRAAEVLYGENGVGSPPPPAPSR